jgi:glycosyltransferase involved in cell wall biosynthesis
MISSTPSPLRVSFVIPLYFTGDGIRLLLETFRELEVPGGFELVLVNDGSTDRTGDLVKAELASLTFPVTLVDLAKNFGEHNAVMEGLRHAAGQYVITLDDDLQNPPAEALRLLAHAEATSAEVVYSYYAEKKHHWFRNLGSRVTNAVATFLLSKPADLYLSSFRCLHRDLVARIIGYRGPFPYIDGLILGATNRIERLLVEHSSRGAGESGYTLRKLVRLWMNLFFNFSIMPLRIASVLGVVLCGFGMLMVLVVMAEHFMGGPQQRGWASLMAAVSIFSGSQLLILGLLGEYVGRAYLTLSGKPQSLVRETLRHEPPPAPPRHP